MSDYYENEREMWSMGNRRYKSNFDKKETIKDVLEYSATDWPERGLRKETLDFFGVRCKINSSSGSIEKVYFPYHDQSGDLCGFKVKDLTKVKKEKGHFYTIGYVGVDCMLFGQKVARKSAKFLFNCEGETDCLATFQSIHDYNKSNDKKGQYSKLYPAVTAIGCGTVHAKEHVSNNLSFINEYKEVRLCYDNDKLSDIEKQKKNPGMRGYEATQDVGNFLLDHQVKFVDWPDDGLKDCNDYLRKHKSKDLARLLLFNTKQHTTAKIVSLGEKFKKGELYKSLNKGVYLDSFPLLMKRLLGVRLSEASLMLAPTGAGKSSVSFEMLCNYVEKRGKGGGVFLEEGLMKLGKRCVARKLEIHPNLYKFDPKKYCTREQYDKAEEWAYDPNNFMFIDHYGPIKIDQLIDLCHIFIHRYKREFIVLDHISLTTTGDGDIEERVELEKAMVSITTLCEQFNVHILVVAHINRAASTTTGTDRSFDKPKWKRTFITDGKGTQALEALAHNIIPIDIELLPDGERGRIRLFLGKNREADNLGFCDIVRMHPETGIFYDASNEIWTPDNTQEEIGY